MEAAAAEAAEAATEYWSESLTAESADDEFDSTSFYNDTTGFYDGDALAD